MLFDIEKEPTLNQRLLKEFSKRCDNFAIVQCYKNKLELNCKYNIEVEEIISKFSDELDVFLTKIIISKIIDKTFEFFIRDFLIFIIN